MRDYLDQLEAVKDANLFYVGLAGALMVPDMAAAMDAEDGRTNASRYPAWFDQHAASRFFGRITGDDCYGLRCSMLHQGRLEPHRGSYSRVLFVEPGATPNVFHCNVIDDVLNVDVRIFVAEVIASAREWLDAVEQTDLYRRNYERTMQRYPQGLAPYIVGVPVIA
jgi:hypothetical protein